MNYTKAVIISRLENAIGHMEEAAEISKQKADQAVDPKDIKLRVDKLIEKLTQQYSAGKYLDCAYSVENTDLRISLRDMAKKQQVRPNYKARDEMLANRDKIRLILDMIQSSKDEYINSMELERLGVYKIVKYQ